MADKNSSREQQKVQYLVQVLQRNPLEESDRIIRGRNRLLGLQTATVKPTRLGADLDHSRKLRERALKQVEQLRQAIWTAPLENLRSGLGSIRAQQFPDIQATVERLSTVVNHRSELPSLTVHPEFDPDLFNAFKQVLASSPREVAILKERQIVAFGNSKRRRRGKKMINLLKKELPALYALEAAWLESLTRQKKPAAVAQTQTSETEFGSSGGGFPWWGYILAVSAIRGLVKIIGAMNE